MTDIDLMAYATMALVLTGWGVIAAYVFGYGAAGWP